MDKYWKPALIAGVVGGVLSAMPILNILNCCCLWIVLPIIWAGYMYKKEYGYVDVGPGAALGALTGGIIGVVSGSLVLVSNAIFNMSGFYQRMFSRLYYRMHMPTENLPYEHYQQMLGMSILGVVIGVVSSVLIGTIVGVIIGAIWQKPTNGPQNPEKPGETIIDVDATVED